MRRKYDAIEEYYLFRFSEAFNKYDIIYDSGVLWFMIIF